MADDLLPRLPAHGEAESARRRAGVDDGAYRGPPPNGGPSFPTEEARADAAQKALNKVVTGYAGDPEGFLAEYYLAGTDADAGKLDQARRKYQDVVDHADASTASVARLALAQIHFAENRPNDARALLKELADHPTDLVSKDQADYTLAKGLAATQPEEARKLLLPLASRIGSDITQAAAAALAELPQPK